MRTPVLVGCSLLLTAVLVGCGAGDADPVKQQIDLMNETSALLEKVTDAASYKDAESKAKALEKKAEDLKAKLKALPEDKQKALLEKHKDALVAATARFMKAGMAAEAKKKG